METVRGLPSITGSMQVHERGAGKQQASAFRRAMQQGADSGQPAAEQPRQPPVRRPLQNEPDRNRKNEGTVRHVDVIA